jgi:hypothetical protein
MPESTPVNIGWLLSDLSHCVYRLRGLKFDIDDQYRRIFELEQRVIAMTAQLQMEAQIAAEERASTIADAWQPESS